MPVVARTGGLADTVIDANDAALAAGVATGFQFAAGRPASLCHASIATPSPSIATRRPGRDAAQRHEGDVSWDRGAARYAALYRRSRVRGMNGGSIVTVARSRSAS